MDLGFLLVPAMMVGAFGLFSMFVDPSSIVVTELTVPPSIEDRGYTGTVPALRFTNEIETITRQAGTNRGNLITSEDARARSVEALTDWFGLAQPFRATQVAVGLLPFTFRGGIFELGDGKLEFQLHGQSPEYADFELVVEGTDDDLNGLFNKAALGLLSEIDPYMVAVYHFRREIPTKDFTQTLAAIDNCLVRVPEEQMPWVYALWGHSFHFRGEYEKAIDKYQHALELNPDFVRPMMRWGETLAAMGDHDAAIAKYQELLAKEPVYPEALVMWAKSLLAQGDKAGGFAKYQEAVEMTPRFARIRRDYGRFLMSEGLYAEAAEEFRTAVTLAPHRESLKTWLRKAQRALDPDLAEAAPVASN